MVIGGSVVPISDRIKEKNGTFNSCRVKQRTDLVLAFDRSITLLGDSLSFSRPVKGYEKEGPCTIVVENVGQVKV